MRSIINFWISERSSTGPSHSEERRMNPSARGNRWVSCCGDAPDRYSRRPSSMVCMLSACPGWLPFECHHILQHQHPL